MLLLVLTRSVPNIQETYLCLWQFQNRMQRLKQSSELMQLSGPDCCQRLDGGSEGNQLNNSIHIGVLLIPAPGAPPAPIFLTRDTEVPPKGIQLGLRAAASKLSSIASLGGSFGS